MKSYVKFVDGSTEPILEWRTPREKRQDSCIVVTPSGEYKYQVEYTDYSILKRSPILPIVRTNKFFKLERRLYTSYSIDEEWIVVDNIDCFVEDRSDELSEVES
jgi:hypothetical protein